MLFQNAEKFLSTARLSSYKAATKGDEQASLRLYLDNLRLAQSFYAPLSLLEVAFRNALHEVLAVSFQSDNWLLTQQSGFMEDSRLTYIDKNRSEQITNRKVQNMIKAAMQEFKERHKYAPPHGTAIIADLQFGFWTTLFSRRYFFILNQAPLRAFPHRPRGTKWETISEKLQEVRKFRNRVYHYEPLCFQKHASNILYFSQLHQIHTTIIELLSWLDPSLPIWLAEADRVPDTLRTIGKKYPHAT